jgi:hypothetical protein
MYRLSRHLVSSSFVACALAGFAACSDDLGPEGTPQPDVMVVGDTGFDGGLTPCIEDSQCQGGETCSAGECRPACDTLNPCTGPLPVCDPSTNSCVECLGPIDCLATESCIANECIPQCTLGAPCGDGQRCDTTTGECVEAECVEDEDCTGGNTCRAGRCIPIDSIICVAGEERCEENTLLRCIEDGTAFEEIDCGALAVCTGEGTEAACEPIPCEPNDIGCVDLETAFICEADGETRTELPCREDQYCEEGICITQLCEPDAVTCENGIIQACDSLGAEQTTTICAEQEECIDSRFGCRCSEDNSCEPRACLAESSRCVGNSVQVCLGDETGFAAPVPCDAEEICRSGACIPARCDAGATSCAGDTLLTCGSDGSSRTETNCAAEGQLCVTVGTESECGDPLCEPDSVSCSSDRLSQVVCDGRGATQTFVACGDGRRCVDNECIESVCDPRTCDEIEAAGIEYPDTDFDGVPDCEESDLDVDGDGQLACDDADSDNDGLEDGEETGCPVSTDRERVDSDGDGYTDRVELIVGSNACAIDSDPTDIVDAVVAVLSGSSVTTTVAWQFGVERADIVFNVDTTGSMGIVIDALPNASRESFLPAFRAIVSDVRVAVSDFRDFPCGTGFGTPGTDYSFRLGQRATSNLSAAYTALESLTLGNGGDLAETGVESLYQIATGAGRTACSGSTVPAFNSALNLVRGVADGTVGGAGLRTDAARLVVHVTDAVSQAFNATSFPYGATTVTAVTELNSRDIRVAAMNTSTSGAADVRTSLLNFASNTNALVPTCAFGTGASRPASCTASQCCTGGAGAGRNVDGGGNCPLVFDVGTAVSSTTIAQTLSRLASVATVGLSYNGNLVARRDATIFASSGFDTTTLVADWSVASTAARADACGGAPSVAGTDVTNSRNGVTYSLSVTINTSSAPEPGVYPVYFDFVSDAGSVLDSASVLVIVE